MTYLIDTPVATWVDPTGEEWQLTNLDPELGYFTMSGVKGFGAVPAALTTDPMPRGGARIRHIQPGPRLITWPIFVEGPDHATFQARWRALAKAFTRTKYDGPGILRVAQPDGTIRQIQAVYQEGWGNATDVVLYDTVVLTLFCPTPWWEDVTETLILREYDAGGADYQDPYPSVSSSQTLGATTATNPGDVEAWPLWTITGPASLITVRNDSTGQSWVLDPNTDGIAHGNLMLGETVTVQTDPPIVRGPDGSVWTGALNWPDATLWPLLPGDNAVTFEVDGSGSGTSVTGTFIARYETV